LQEEEKTWKTQDLENNKFKEVLFKKGKELD
jgi:hypothetical protein